MHVAHFSFSTNLKELTKKSLTFQPELLAFWAPFLLLHLGGPDSITAFALEDNELWIRQLLRLVVQVVAAVYIFFQSLHGNKLLFPTVLVFIASMIKYFERIRALYLASLEKFRDISLKMLCLVKMIVLFRYRKAEIMSSFGSVVAAFSIFYFQLDKHGFNEFDVRLTYTLFLGAIALDIIAFFILVSSDWTFVALRNYGEKSKLGKFKNGIAAVNHRFLILKSPRWQRPHVDDKHKVLAVPFLFRRWSGSVSGISWTRYWLKVPPSRVNEVKNGFHPAWQKVIHYLRIGRLIPRKAIAVDNVTRFLHISKIIDDIRIQRSLSHQPLTEELWQFIFYEIKRKAQYAEDPEAGVKRTVCSASGHCTLQELGANGDHLIKIMEKISKNYVYFSINVTVPVWHLSTELLYNTAEEASNEQTNNARLFSKILSDYMLYLLLLKPTMMNSSPIYTKRILRRTNSAADELLEKNGIKSRPAKAACKKIMDEPVPESSDSALEDAINWPTGFKSWMRIRNGRQIAEYGWRFCHTEQVIAHQWHTPSMLPMVESLLLLFGY
ncbi:DUF4220 domain-containing protein [Citrus sinensis]|uniref:DUF4220 domain-containing protein n=1 Tax=Citrus sinensis TaxID=2711 RepID=A0ACB8JL69_CITSI|nr:DUF4220 domain-containing protein [Citrus sinensis]